MTAEVAAPTVNQELMDKQELTEGDSIALLNYATELIPFVSEQLQADPEFSLERQAEKKEMTYAEQFARVVGKLGNPDTVMTLGTTSADSLALLSLGVLHQHNSGDLITKLRLDRPLKYLLDQQLSAVTESPSKGSEVIGSILTKTGRKSLMKLDSQAITQEAGAFIDDVTQKSNAYELPHISPVVYTAKFSEANPLPAFRFLQKVSDELSEAVKSTRDVPHIEHVVDQLRHERMRVTTRILRTQSSDSKLPEIHQGLPALITHIGETMLPMLTVDNAYAFRSLVTKITEWEYHYSMYFTGTELPARIRNEVTKILANIVDPGQTERLHREPTSSYMLVDLFLGYLINSAAVPRQSILVSDNDKNTVADFARSSEIISHGLLTEHGGTELLIRALVALSELRGARPDVSTLSSDLNGVLSASYLMIHSPDILNAVTNPDVQEFITSHLDPAEILIGVRHTANRWIDFITRGLSVDAGDEERAGALILLERLSPILGNINIGEVMQADAGVPAFLQDRSGDTRAQVIEVWKKLMPQVRDYLAEVFNNEITGYIIGWLYVPGYLQEKFRNDFFNILSAYGQEKGLDFGAWFFELVRHHMKRPEIGQVLSGIVLSDDQPARKLELLEQAHKPGNPEPILQGWVDKSLGKAVRGRIIEQLLRKDNLDLFLGAPQENPPETQSVPETV